MKILHYVLTIAVIISTTIYAKNEIENVQFKSMEGVDYDLYKLLEAKKHVLFQTQMNICPFTPPNIPGMNETWEKYGCNDYDLAVFIVNICTGDQKEEFTRYCDSFSVQYERVFSTDGGYFLSKAVDNNQTPKQFLVYPDKTWKDAVNYATDLTEAGIQEHECDSSTYIIANRNMKSYKELSLLGMNTNAIELGVHHAGVYALTFFSTNGKAIRSIKRKLHRGFNRIALGLNQSSNSVLFLSINHDGNMTAQKVFRLVNVE